MDTPLLRRSRPNWRAATIAIATIAAVSIMYFLWVNEDHHLLSAKYNLWKLGALELPVDSPIRYQFLNVDASFRESMIGKRKEYIEKWYPLVPRGSGNSYQKSYESEMGSKEYYWLGYSAWAIEIKGERIVEFHLFKG